VSAPWVEWEEGGATRRARWHSEAGVPAPARVRVADDTLTADAAVSLASEGTSLLWRGDFHNARQLLDAMARRMARAARKHAGKAPDLKEAFHRYRLTQGQRARMLGRLLIPLDADRCIPLARAPDLRVAVAEAWGPAEGEPSLVALRELQGLVGAHEWRRKGVEVPELGSPPANRIHPHYGVFSPVRGEYLHLIAKAPLPAQDLAFDIGTGTGVLAAILARRGMRRVIATDTSPRARACAVDNLTRLGLAAAVEVIDADLFPPGRAPLVVCNPPWLPGRPASMLEEAVYDPSSRMLRGFLAGLREHLVTGGEGWLVMSDLAELLGLRAPGELEGWIEAAGLQVLGRLTARPRHGRPGDAEDALHAARSRETTSLWRLGSR
jgi:methylase of polypeptide subunit release factors